MSFLSQHRLNWKCYDNPLNSIDLSANIFEAVVQTVPSLCLILILYLFFFSFFPISPCKSSLQHNSTTLKQYLPNQNTLNARTTVLVSVHYMACQFIHPLPSLHADQKHLKLSAKTPFYNLCNVKCYSLYSFLWDFMSNWLFIGALQRMRVGLINSRFWLHVALYKLGNIYHIGTIEFGYYLKWHSSGYYFMFRW